MKEISINDGKLVKGKFSVVNENENGQIVSYGQLVTHRYYEEINTIESERYLAENVEVVKEEFGSEDFYILYTFTCDLTIKGGETPYTDEEIEEYELTNELFGGE